MYATVALACKFSELDVWAYSVENKTLVCQSSKRNKAMTRHPKLNSLPYHSPSPFQEKSQHYYFKVRIINTVLKWADRENIPEPTFRSLCHLGDAGSTSWQVRKNLRNTCSTTTRLLTAFHLSAVDGTCLPVVFRYLGLLTLISRVVSGWLGFALCELRAKNCGELPSLSLCQGGPVVELLSGQGKDPVARWKLSGGPAAIQKVSEFHSCSAAGNGCTHYCTLLQKGRLLSTAVFPKLVWVEAVTKGKINK